MDCKTGGRRNWLDYHPQRRVVKGSISSGIPLGWIEGPVLFSISMVTEMMEAGYGLFLLYQRSSCFNYLLSVANRYREDIFLVCICLFEAEKLLRSWEKRHME